MSTNLDLWNSFGKTDPQYTKGANVDGNKQTSISGNYMVKLATEQLGPIGEGWGYKIIEDRFDDTRPAMTKINDAPAMLMDGENIVWEKNHTILIELWHGKPENKIYQYGHTKFRYMKADGSKMIVDNECAKKSLTDAMKKCLSLLGICADVFMGEFDDVNYQAAAKTENDLKNADNRDQEYRTKLDELEAFVADKVKAMGLCPDMAAVSKVYGMASAKIDREAPVLGLESADVKKPLDAAYFEADAKFKEVA